MGRRWSRLAAVGMAMAMAVSAMAGCGKRATPENLMEDMSKNTESIESMLCNLKLAMELSAGTDSMGISLDMDLEATMNPETSHGKGRIDMNMSGTNIGTDIEMYTLLEDEQYVTYSMIENEWTKTVDTETREMLNEAAILDLNERIVEMELAEETTEVNGKECFELTGKIPGDTVTALFNEDLLDSLTSGMSVDESALADTDIPCTIDIYRDTILPARMYLDLGAYSDVLLEGMDGVSMSEYNIEITFLEFDRVDAIKVPEEAMAAAGDAVTEEIPDDVWADDGAGASAGAAEQSGELGSSWDSYTVQINDRVVTLPCTIADLEAAGLRLDVSYTPENYVVNAGEYELVWFIDSNGNEITADMINPDSSPKEVKDCLIGGISVDQYSQENGGLTVIFPGGIQIGSTREEVQAAYGEADDVYEGEYTDMHTWYDTDYYSWCEIDFDAETGLVSSMYLDHYE